MKFIHNLLETQRKPDWSFPKRRKVANHYGKAVLPFYESSGTKLNKIPKTRSPSLGLRAFPYLLQPSGWIFHKALAFPLFMNLLLWGNGRSKVKRKGVNVESANNEERNQWGIGRSHWEPRIRITQKIEQFPLMKAYYRENISVATKIFISNF